MISSETQAWGFSSCYTPDLHLTLKNLKVLCPISQPTREFLGNCRSCHLVATWHKIDFSVSYCKLLLDRNLDKPTNILSKQSLILFPGNKKEVCIMWLFHWFIKYLQTLAGFITTLKPHPIQWQIHTAARIDQSNSQFFIRIRGLSCRLWIEGYGLYPSFLFMPTDGKNHRFVWMAFGQS